MAEVKRYKLRVQYEITAELYENSEPVAQQYGRQTERLTIDDTFDLKDATDLTAVLAKIDAVHKVLKP